MKRLLLLILFPLYLFSCKEDSIEIPETSEVNPDIPVIINPENIDHTVLIYAVNNSSLSYDFYEDKNEILKAADLIDLSKYQILIFKTDSETKCSLYEVKKDKKSESAYLYLLKEYERNMISTDPRRIKEVIEFSLGIYPNSSYDLIFWGHGMSWKPYFSDHIIDKPQSYAYGGEYSGGLTESGGRETDWIEIDDLARCVPDNAFDTIWFDCCYMSGIEVIYEFKNKCKTFVGYPSEVWSNGLNYDKVLPYLLSSKHDIKGAANAFFEYYNATNDPVTIAVINMDLLEPVADYARMIISNSKNFPEKRNLVNYSRTASSPFYDFNQYFIRTADLNSKNELIEKFKTSVSNMTIYHAESSIDFNKRPWDKENISGISTHYYLGDGSTDERYYETLSWFKRIYE